VIELVIIQGFINTSLAWIRNLSLTFLAQKFIVLGSRQRKIRLWYVMFSLWI